MKQLPTFLMDNITHVVLLFIICAGILLLLLHDWNTTRRKAKHAKPIYCHDFLERWDLFRKNDKPGCYIILIYKRRPSSRKIRKLKGFDEVYIGQSINMHKRVYNHFTGHGNGDVYADVKYKRFVYVKFVPCKTERLNSYEKQLIDTFDATTSYNRTKGGAKLTQR